MEYLDKNPQATSSQIVEFVMRQPDFYDAVGSIIVSRFVDGYDFNNGALAHKSASGWADMLISEYFFLEAGNEQTDDYKADEGIKNYDIFKQF